MPDILRDNSIDLILCDLPYGVTRNKWDCEIDLNELFKEYWRVLKENRTIVLTAQQPFTSKLITHQHKNFRYELIWDKVRTSGFLNANRMPLRSHENILVFYKNLGTYNPQFTIGEKSHSKGSMKKDVNRNYGKYRAVDNSNVHGSRKFPKSILEFVKPHPSIHPTQKPVELFEWIIKSFSNEGDLVLDNCIGVGTTALACKRNNRLFIGIEKEQEYVEIAMKRLQQSNLREYAEEGSKEMIIWH